MKLQELLEASYSGRRKMRHSGTEHFGLRIEVTKAQKTEIEDRIKKLLGLHEDEYSVGYTAPEQASTFPCDIRVCLRPKSPAYDKDTLQGGIIVKMTAAAIRKAFKEVLGIDVKPELDSDHLANGLRYIDHKVGWAGK